MAGIRKSTSNSGRAGVQVVVTVEDRTTLLGALVHAMAAAQSRKAAYAAREDARNRVPVQSGALQSTIQVNRIGVGEYELSAGDDEVDYAAAVEFGTYKMSARPYFAPALEAGRKIMVAGPEKKL